MLFSRTSVMSVLNVVAHSQLRWTGLLTGEDLA